MLKTEPVLQLTRSEIYQRLEAGARRRCGMPAADLIRLYNAGRLVNPGAIADLLSLAHLLPDDDPLFVST
ncbi:MAG: hypothetical protein HYY64_15675 [Candidatus Rokubacteria bacterium]|nr:hypothetical protein [Candidatus Rokubacteria bacterium]